MASRNLVIVMGNVGRDVEVRYMPSGDAVANLSIATSETWKDKATGEKKEATEWHKVVFYGKLAEVVGQYVKKGSSIYIEGSLHTKKWTDKDGQEKYSTEIKANFMQMLGSKPGENSNDSQPSQANTPTRSLVDMEDDSINF